MELNKDLFKREYLCKWYNDYAYEEAYKQHIYYQYMCELYDKKICSGREDRQGFIVPASNIESGLCNKNALKYHREMMDKIQRYNMNSEQIITADILQKSKLEVSRLTWDGIQNEYFRLFENVEI